MTESVKKIPLVVVSGASGSGKTTLCHMIANDLNYHYGVSHTTRQQRENEVNGKDYHFINHERFKKMIESGSFLEWAQVYDNYYGTSKAEVFEKLKSHTGVILDVDTQGALSVKNSIPEAVLVFLKVPYKDLKERLEKRGTETNEALEKRLKQVSLEESFQGAYNKVILNKDLDTSYQELKKFILENHS